MTTTAAFAAFAELALMLAVVAGYMLIARRHRILWHPLAIVLAVGTVGVVVSVLGELLFRSGAGVHAMLRRSAIGGLRLGRRHCHRGVGRPSPTCEVAGTTSEMSVHTCGS